MGIANTNEALYWATGIDFTGLSSDAKQVEQVIRQMTGNSGRSFNALNLIFGAFGKIKDSYSSGVLSIGKGLLGMGASANVARVAATALMGTMTLGVGVAIAALTVAYVKWNKKQEESLRLQKEFQAAQKKGYENAETEVSKIQQLQRVAANLNEPMSKRVEALNKLNFIMPTYNGYLDKETGKLIANKDALIDYVRALAGMEVAKQLGVKNAERTLKMIQSENDVAEVLAGRKLSPIKKQTTKRVLMGSGTGPGAQPAAGKSASDIYAKSDAQYYAEEQEKYRKKLQEENDKTEEVIKKLMPTTPKSLDDYDDGKGGNGGKGRGGSNKTVEDLSAGRIEAQLKLERERLEIMQDGKQKRLELSNQEWKEQKAQLEKEHTERLEKYKEQGKEMPQTEIDTYNSRLGVNDEAKTKRDAGIEKEYKDELANMYKDVADVFLTEEERKKKAIKDRYDDERRRALELLNNGGINQDEFKAVNDKIDASETEEQRQRMIEGLDDFKQQEFDLINSWNDRIAELEVSGQTRAADEARKQRDLQLNDLNAQMLTQSDEWVTLFDEMSALTDKEIDNLISSIKAKMNSGEFKLNPVDTQNFIRSLEQARDGMKSPINKIISSFKAFKKAKEEQAEAERKLANWKAIGASEEDIKAATAEVRKFKTEAQEAAEGVAAGFATAREMIDSIGGSITSVADAFGADTRQLENVTKLLGGVATAGQGVAKIASGDVVGGIMDVAKGLSDVLVSIAGISDTERQKRIEKLTESVDALKKKYEDMGTAREKAFSTDKADIINQQSDNLRKQNEDIKKMMYEEDKKKKTDKDKLKEWQNQIDENNKKIQENKDATIEALAGTDVMSAIDEFAQAYANAWASGESAAKKSADVVKGILRNALINYMKGQLQPEVDALMQKIAESMKDGQISDAEQSSIDAIVNQLDQKSEQYKNALDPYLDKGDRKGVTGELQAAMTEGTASQLVGLWNMTAMDIRAIKEYFERNGIADVGKELNAMLNELSEIKLNTKRGADNTDGIKEQFDTMNSKLEDIKNNTKPNSSRG